tara:strand:+ start:214 stop:672 length:459 start_codon:yes stop_codon:yes gene_type:complete
MKNKIVIIFIFLVISHCTAEEVSINQDLADEDQINWCIAKLNLLRTNSAYNRLDDEDLTIDTNRKSAWEILKQNNIIPGDKKFIDLYAGGDYDLWNSYLDEFYITYKDNVNSNIQDMNTWDYGDSLVLNKYFLNNNNEFALRQCKIWKDISQ